MFFFSHRDCAGSFSQENQRLASAIAGESEAPVQNNDGDSSLNKESTSREQLQEVIVTAQKRSERLQDVPIPMSVLSGNALDRSTTQGPDE